MSTERIATYLFAYSPVAGSFDTTGDFGRSATTTTGPIALSSNSSDRGRLCVSVRVAPAIVVAAAAAVEAWILDLLVLALVGLVAGYHRISIYIFRSTETTPQLTLTAVEAAWLARLWALTRHVVGGLAVVTGASWARLCAIFGEVSHLLAIAAGDVLGASRLWAIGGCHDVSISVWRWN